MDQCFFLWRGGERGGGGGGGSQIAAMAAMEGLGIRVRV